MSSGAIAKGIQELNLELRPKSLNLLQATAAVGQLGLINSYREAFKKYNLITGQVLVSHSDIVSRQRYLNARHSLTALLNLKVILLNAGLMQSIQKVLSPLQEKLHSIINRAV